MPDQGYHAVPAVTRQVCRALDTPPGRHDIEVVIELDSDACLTRVDPGQLEQVILNLVANARDAMPAGGMLRVGTAKIVLDEAASRRHAETNPGEYVTLFVTDTGVGMTPEVRARIFEPFFTTKPPGSGTGLGLAMCYGIVKQSGGHVQVESDPGQGSRFTVLLPREASAAPVPAAASDGHPPAGHETILLVEDDASVRELTSRMLGSAGYRVIEASDAATARECAEKIGGAIDLLLADVVMPGGGGQELAEAMTARIPGLRVLFMSGYTADVVLRQGIVQEEVAFLPKPFSPDALAVAVREALDGPAT